MRLNKLLILLFISISACEFIGTSYTYKVVLLGDNGVGKSTLLRQCASSKKIQENNKLKSASIDNLPIAGHQITLNVYIIPGNVEDNDTTLDCLKDADGVIFCYKDYDSFKNICLKWCPIVEKYCKKTIQTMLVGNDFKSVKPTQLPYDEEIEALGRGIFTAGTNKCDFLNMNLDLVRLSVFGGISLGIYRFPDNTMAMDNINNAASVLKQHNNAPNDPQQICCRCC